MKKLFCFSLIGIFIFSNVAFAVETEPVSAMSPLADSKSKEEPKDIFDLVIPSSWGRIREVYNGNKDFVVVHIQDAHCNYEAQQNIAKILDRLVENYGVKVAGIEGAAGKLETELFATFPDDEIREQAADYFVREGKLSGPEALAISKGFEYPLQLYGIEEKDLYLNNFNAFKASYPFKDEVKNHLSYINNYLGQLKAHLYSQEISEIDRQQVSFDIGVSNLNDYVLFLEKMNGFLQFDSDKYPNLVRLLTSIKIEDKIDFAKAEEERAQLLTELTNVLSEEDMRKLLDKGLEYRNEQLSAARYFDFVKEMALKNEFDFAEYQNLDKYIEYVKSYDEIKSLELFNEIEEVDQALREKIYTNETQKKLDFLAKGLKVMRRLIEIKMVNKDLEFYKSHQEELKMSRYTGFIKEQSDMFGLHFELPMDISYIDVYIPAWVDFYRVAGLRDEAMINNTLNAMKEHNQKLGVMVTGGFHTRELTRLMRTQDISHIVITPRITQNVPGPYFDRLTGKEAPFDVFMEGLQAVVPETEPVKVN